MDGNQDREAMTVDLESMHKAGMRKAVFLEVNLGMPRGPVDFMSEEWQENFAHAVRKADQLGMEIILGTGPGWAGAGGPWVVRLVRCNIFAPAPCASRVLDLALRSCRCRLPVTQPRLPGCRPNWLKSAMHGMNERREKDSLPACDQPRSSMGGPSIGFLRYVR